jgi:hypothetical protein
MESYKTYLKAKVDCEVLEQQVKQCQDAVLLPGLNFQLRKSARSLNQLFWYGSDEVDD